MIEALPLQTRQGYKAIGLDLLTEAPTTEDIVLFQDAFTLLKAGSGLSDAVVALVRSVHLLAGSGNGYDTSHSEPNLPCSIFVSVPTGQQYAEFRLAESILHEAMHLQLTMLEKEAPLLCNTSATGYSPWQQTVRPVKGLLHGLFVFSVINQWLAELRAGGVLGEEGHIYIARRRAQIAEEVAMVSELSVYPALTEFGRTFADWLIGTRS
ncbi:MAG: HEXXH motif-containing putative peptide modification protein [Halieaceae bacterium]|nr:HEXXH motif-containing putative peptide modification protein [Halieaceae bacterium]